MEYSIYHHEYVQDNSLEWKGLKELFPNKFWADY